MVSSAPESAGFVRALDWAGSYDGHMQKVVAGARRSSLWFRARA